MSNKGYKTQTNNITLIHRRFLDCNKFPGKCLSNVSHGLQWGCIECYICCYCILKGKNHMYRYDNILQLADQLPAKREKNHWVFLSSYSVIKKAKWQQGQLTPPPHTYASTSQIYNTLFIRITGTQKKLPLAVSLRIG